MTAMDFQALLPLLVLGIGATLLMLQIAWVRSPGLTGALAALDSAGVRADSPEARQAVGEARAGLESDQPEVN